MALAQYSDLFWYPSTELAIGVQVRVFDIDDNVLVPLFTDGTGTVPLANPVTTSATGTIDFWVEAGEYWLHADSEAFRISVGLPPVTPGEIAALQAAIAALQADVAAVEGDVTALQADITVLETDVTALQGDVVDVEAMASTAISTGISAGGDISVNGSNPAAIDIAPFEGYFTDFSTDPFNPVITRIEYPGTTVAMDGPALLRTATAWLMDPDLNIIQQATPPTNAQRRTHIFLGVTAQVGGVIIVDQSLPVILQQPADQFTDLLTSLGAFNVSGNRITPNGVNLMINQSSGELFSQAFNHFAGAVQTNDPHVSTTIAQTPASFRYTTSTSTTFGPLRTTIDVANYDVGGVVTPIGGGAGSSTIHRVYLFPNNTATEQIAMQYGMTTYSSLSAAADRVGAGISFVPNPVMRAAALIGYIVATRTATNLSDPAQAMFVTAGKFATP